MDEKLTIFIAVASAAVVLQMLILLGMYLTLPKLGAHINSVANEVKSQVFPLLESGKHLLSDIKRILETSSPKVELVLDNAASITTTAYAGIGRVEGVLLHPARQPRRRSWFRPANDEEPMRSAHSVL